MGIHFSHARASLELYVMDVVNEEMREDCRRAMKCLKKVYACSSFLLRRRCEHPIGSETMR